MIEVSHIPRSLRLMSPSLPPSRSLVEAIVRETLLGQLTRPWPSLPPEPAPVLVVNSSARHMHISPQNLELLFVPGAQLTVHKWLYQVVSLKRNKWLRLL